MNVAETKEKILTLLKERGEATTAMLAGWLDVTYEATRQQVRQLEEGGLVRSQQRANPSGTGRPLRYYSLSVAGEQQFPKRYGALAIALIEAVDEALGRESLRQVLAAISDKQVTGWAAQLADKDLRQRLEELREIYLEDDPFTEVRDGDEGPQLVERNCPYLRTALERPALCSVTVSTLEQLLGRRVSRVKRFQDGDGCCVFQAHVEDVLDAEQQGFRFEETSET